MRVKLTKFESSWMRIFIGLTFIIVAVLFIIPLLPSQEPLADADSLRALQKGGTLSVPIDEPRGHFHGTTVDSPSLAFLQQVTNVMGVTEPVTTPTLSDFKRIEVDLTNQKVYAFEGDRLVYEFLVSTGKWGRTPTGEFRIWAKVRSQKMEGGNKEKNTYYYLPNVPYVMFFYNNEIAKMRGFSFHGTYWHSNFGHPMSHGCVNMKTEEAGILYEWATPTITNPKAWSTLATAENQGTKVIVYGVTPNE